MTDRSEYSFGELFHTALRKGADTKWSVLLWNLIYIVDTGDSAWIKFCEFAQPKWEAGEQPSVIAREFAKERHFGNVNLNCFTAALELCDEQTMKEIDEYIKCCLEA